MSTIDTNPLHLAPHAKLVGTLYSEHHQWLRGWLRKKMGNAFDADDLSHDTFVKLLGKLDQLVIQDPRAYLSTIAHGLVVNHWRRQDLERAYLETLAQTPELSAPSPETCALVLEVLLTLDALLDTLNPKARCAFLLSQLEGLTYLEIAERLAVSERMVKKYMAQAMLQCLKCDIDLS